MNNKEFALNTKQFIYEMNNKKENLFNEILDKTEFKDDIFIHMSINRLYYALYNRIIEELPHIKHSSKGSKHKQILQELSQNQNPTIRNTLRIFRELQDLRITADYYPEQTLPNLSLNVLIAKVNRILNYKKIF